MAPLAKNATRPGWRSPLETRIGGRLHVVADRVVGRRAFGDADQNPVARLRFEPDANFLFLPFIETQTHDRGAGLRRRLEFQPHDAVLIDVERRFARTDRDHLVVVERFDFPPRAIRCFDAPAAERAGTRRLAVRIDHAQCDRRMRAAIRDQRRCFTHELGTNRAARVVNCALSRGTSLSQHRGRRATSSLSPSRRSTPRQRLSATVCALIVDTPSKLSGADRAPLTTARALRRQMMDRRL